MLCCSFPPRLEKNSAHGTSISFSPDSHSQVQRSLHTESSSLWIRTLLPSWTHFVGLNIIGHLVVIVEHLHGSISVTITAHWGLSVCNVATDRTHGRLPPAVQCCRWWPTVQCTAHTVQLYNNIGRNVTGTQACRCWLRTRNHDKQ